MKKLFCILSMILIALFSFNAVCEVIVDDNVAITDDLLVEYGEYYYTTDEVSLYLHAFCELPYNYITKSEARDLGWDSSRGNLWDVAYGCCIGGDRFGNYEGLLPNASGRTWYECDVEYYGGHRGPERLLFSSDGMICYSGDHYRSYEILYTQWYDESEG